MKKKTRNIIIAITAVLLAAALCAAVLYATRGDIKAAADTKIRCGNSTVYYNDIKGRLCSVKETGGRGRVIAKDAQLLSAYGDSVLVRSDEGLKILSSEGEVRITLPEEDSFAAQLDRDGIYYVNSDLSLWRMSEYGTEKEKVLDAPVKDFIIYGKSVIYTPDGNSLLVKDTESGEEGVIVSGLEITSFSADDDYLFISNSNNGNTLLKIRVGGQAEQLFTIRTTNFAFKNGRLHYLENADGGKAEYEIVHDPIMVHGR